ncbi:MBL fold metallo-hydrolase [Bacillus sp. Marseille-P3661]|uniref:MBL fold metallo-hydrolase n=1 Tax=Bacillus sp. Marseille-P3661 TaxID=1936234 RepID=UPI000C867940|nr:MBL fold metallo-hydrolase [Bacillus sp. Marseille-P3661]
MSDVKIIMLGTGSPRPDIERGGSAQVLLIDALPILVDCGEGTTRQLMKVGIPPETVEHLWFTHLHSDHVMGYLQFLLGGWTAGRSKLTVVGPKGTKNFHETIMNLFEEDIVYRTSLGRSPEGLLDVNIIEVEEAGEVPTDLPVKVTADQMIHNVPTFAYRFEIEETVVVFSGDTAPNERIIELSRDADILIHDAALAKNAAYKPPLSPERQKMWDNLQKEHCTPAQAGEIAFKAGAKQLVLTHFLPKIDLELAYQEVSEVYSGSVIVPEDLQVIPVKKRLKI